MPKVPNNNRKKIKITCHARLRLQERFPEIDSRNYNNFIAAARYTGYTSNEVMRKNPEVGKYICKRFREYRSYTLRVRKDGVYIFGGDHDRTLITAVRIPYNMDIIMGE